MQGPYSMANNTQMKDCPTSIISEWVVYRLYRQSQDRVELPFIQQNQIRVKL